jgi:hypothetical protein
MLRVLTALQAASDIEATARILFWCRCLESPSDMTTKTIIKRIILNSQAFEERQARKVKSEEEYYSSKKEYIGER